MSEDTDTREEINGFDVDLLARSLYDARSMRQQPCTDAQWARHGRMFGVTHKLLLAEARQIAEEE